MIHFRIANVLFGLAKCIVCKLELDSVTCDFVTLSTFHKSSAKIVTYYTINYIIFNII